MRSSRDGTVSPSTAIWAAESVRERRRDGLSTERRCTVVLLPYCLLVRGRAGPVGSVYDSAQPPARSADSAYVPRGALAAAKSAQATRCGYRKYQK